MGRDGRAIEHVITAADDYGAEGSQKQPYDWQTSVIIPVTITKLTLAKHRVRICADPVR
jgi:hypothetical protein